MIAERENKVFREYSLQQASDITSSIISPTMKANNWSLALPSPPSWREISSGEPFEQPLQGPSQILAKCDTIKFNRVSSDAI